MYIPTPSKESATEGMVGDDLFNETTYMAVDSSST